jgi:hypothetical protein
MPKGKVKWIQVNTDKFPADVKAAFKKWQTAYNALSDAQDEFNEKAKAHLEKEKKIPQDKVPAFNYTGKALMIYFKDPSEATASDKGMFSF